MNTENKANNTRQEFRHFIYGLGIGCALTATTLSFLCKIPASLYEPRKINQEAQIMTISLERAKYEDGSYNPYNMPGAKLTMYKPHPDSAISKIILKYMNINVPFGVKNNNMTAHGWIILREGSADEKYYQEHGKEDSNLVYIVDPREPTMERCENVWQALENRIGIRKASYDPQYFMTGP